MDGGKFCLDEITVIGFIAEWNKIIKKQSTEKSKYPLFFKSDNKFSSGKKMRFEMHFQPLDNETRKSQLHYENSKHGGKGEISTLGYGWN